MFNKFLFFFKDKFNKTKSDSEDKYEFNQFLIGCTGDYEKALKIFEDLYPGVIDDKSKCKF